MSHTIAARVSDRALQRIDRARRRARRLGVEPSRAALLRELVVLGLKELDRLERLRRRGAE